MQLTDEDRSMILDPTLCKMWLATYAEPGHFALMNKACLHTCFVAAARLVGLDYGLKDAAERTAAEKIQFLKDNLEEAQKQFRKTGHNKEMDRA